MFDDFRDGEYKIIENKRESQDLFNDEMDTCGTTKIVLTKQEIDLLLQGKCLACFDGEYSTFITVKD